MTEITPICAHLQTFGMCKNQQVTFAEFASIHTILFVVMNWHFLVIITLTNKGISFFLDIPS
jgi:hypothetical protein